jgi:hypothetical protein
MVRPIPRYWHDLCCLSSIKIEDNMPTSLWTERSDWAPFPPPASKARRDDPAPAPPLVLYSPPKGGGCS